jgi:hypothetical protein
MVMLISISYKSIQKKPPLKVTFLVSLCDVNYYSFLWARKCVGMSARGCGSFPTLR